MKSDGSVIKAGWLPYNIHPYCEQTEKSNRKLLTTIASLYVKFKREAPQYAILQVSVLLCNLCYALIPSATGSTQYKEIRPASCT